MQQPRQMYGLGSFVKKGVRKLTKPITKVAKKIVPKEIAGIMRTAAPFLPPGYREAAYLLGTAKQTGRISPVDLALTAAPTFFSKTDVGRNIASRIGGIKVPFTGEEGKTLGEILVGSPAEYESRVRSVTEKIPYTDNLDASGFTEKTFSFRDPKLVKEATSGILGEGGKFFQIGRPGGGPGILDTKAGQFLLGDDKGGFSKAKLAGIGVTALSLIQDSETPEEAGNKLAAATGDSDDYERGYNLFSQLTPELFRVPERFRMQVPAQSGGLMRTNYALGSDDNPNAEPINPFKPKPIGPILPEEDKPFRPRPLKPLKMSEEDKEPMLMAGSDRYQRILEQLINELEDQLGRELTDAEYDMVGRMAYEKLNDPDFAVGGRVNHALGTKPTAEESGLGGLPIEADMRYTGGFMPYGAKEKADDVPARLSKNEFVFTADAVRAAGGGSVNEGAKRMYATMKQLEAKPEAKGMRA